MHPLLPVCTQDLAPIGGSLGTERDDFRVDEVPLYPFSGAGQHRLVRLQKRGATTDELVRVIARAAGLRPRDIGYAGMKDKHAITSQWVSFLEHGSTPVAEWELPDGYEVLEATLHDNKLRTGHLKGNQFTLRLRDVERASAAPALSARLQERGLFNFYGQQRFGHEGQNWSRAIEWLRSGRIDRRRRFENKLYPSVIQAELFNRYARARIALGLDRLICGEVVRLKGTGSYFVVEELEAEQLRFAAGDLVLTGPITGPKMRAAQDRAAELEREVYAEAGLGDEDLLRLGRLAPGTRRDLVVPLEDLAFRELGAGSAELTFFLPAGSYATRVLVEFTHGAEPEALRAARMQPATGGAASADSDVESAE